MKNEMKNSGTPYEAPCSQSVALCEEDGVLNKGSNENYTEFIIDLDD